MVTSVGTLSSVGIGTSNLDVKGIVSALVAIEKQPLNSLQIKATNFQSQLSTYGTIKSQMSTLYDAAALLSGPSGWNSKTASSSNSTAVSVTATSSAAATTMTVEVSQLARAQTSASATVTTGTAVGASGSLSIEIGNWSSGSFVASGTSASISIASTDTMSSIASKINAASAGVTATVLKDGTNDRLVLKSSSTGTAAGFRLNSPADSGLSALGLTNPGDTGAIGQTALDATYKINGISQTSGTNKISDVVTGVTLQLNQVTTSAAEVTISTDTTTIQKNIQSFVDAYNALNTTLKDATKYDSTTKVAGVLQADATTVGIQQALNSILRSSSTGSTYSTLSEVGLERQTDGSLKLNQTKLTSAMSDTTNLKALFATNNSNTSTNGFGLKVRDFTHNMITYDGRVTTKTTAINNAITQNAKDQTTVTNHASQVEQRLLAQYSALDTKMASLTGLNSYVTAQLAQWNKSSS